MPAAAMAASASAGRCRDAHRAVQRGVARELDVAGDLDRERLHVAGEARLTSPGHPLPHRRTWSDASGVSPTAASPVGGTRRGQVGLAAEPDVQRAGVEPAVDHAPVGPSRHLQLERDPMLEPRAVERQPQLAGRERDLARR